MEARVLKSYCVLCIGVVSVSFAAIFIRLAAVPPPVIAALRMIFSSVLLVPWAFGSKVFRRELGHLTLVDYLFLLLSGVFLSLHFILWITSLALTGVASSVVFVATNPLFVALYTVVILREGVSRVFWIGLLIAVFGGMILGGGDIIGGGSRWKGDLLAIAGAAAAAGYFLVGSRLRKRLSLITYIYPVYSFAAIILAATVFAMNSTLIGYSWKSYLYCFLMALVCQISGHSIFNWALKHMKATIVAIVVLGEPVGACILALLILGEALVASEIIGGLFILSGVFLVLHFYPGVMISDRGVSSKR